MGLSEIIAVIEAEGAAEVAAIEADTAERVEAIVAEATLRADSHRLVVASADDDLVRVEAQRRLRRGNIESRTIRRSAAAEQLDRLFEVLGERMVRARDNRGYPETFQDLFDEAWALLPEATLALIDARDHQLLHSALVKHKTQLVVENTPCWGGLVLVSKDGRRVDNRLETRLAQCVPALRQSFALWFVEITGEVSA